MAVEDINMKAMSQCLKFGKSVMDDGYGMFRNNNVCKSLLVGSAPKPLPASAGAVVIFTKRESRHASIACKTQERGMTAAFISAHRLKRI